MDDDADPIMEAVTALRAVGVAVAPIGYELERWQIGDLVFSDHERSPDRTTTPLSESWSYNASEPA